MIMENGNLMNDLLALPEQRAGSSMEEPPLKHRSLGHTVLRVSIGLVIVLAFVCSTILLANDVPWPAFKPLAHAPVSALPLMLIGIAALGFQLVVRPNWLDLLKAFIVSAAFLLWGVDQLLPAGWLATTMGDVVIVLYVIDLGWMMKDRLRQH
jgi:hypothetical protein